MVNLQSAQLDLLFYALSDATRREILAMIRDQAHTITELSTPFKMSLAAVSKHIKILERANLLTRHRSGRIHSCTLNPEALHQADAAIKFYTDFWNQRLDLLAQQLEREGTTDHDHPNRNRKK